MLMSRLIRLWPRGTSEAREDYLSECFAELLDADPDFLGQFLDQAFPGKGFGQIDDAGVRTQYSLQGSRFDILIRGRINSIPTTVIVENKIDAQLGEHEEKGPGDGEYRRVSQIIQYMRFENWFEDLRVLYIGRQTNPEAEVGIRDDQLDRFSQTTWSSVSGLLKRAPSSTSAVAQYLRNNLLEFLEDNGMGDNQLNATEIVGATKLWRFAEKSHAILTTAKNSLPARPPYDFAKFRNHQWSDSNGYMGYFMSLPTQIDCNMAICIRYNHKTIEPDIPDLQFHVEAHPKTWFNEFMRSEYVSSLMNSMAPYLEAQNINGGQDLNAKWRVINLRKSMKYVLSSDDQEADVVNFYVGLYEELDRLGFWEKILEMDKGAG